MTFEGRFGNILTVVTLCAQLTRDLLAIAKFLVSLISRGRFVSVEHTLDLASLYRSVVVKGY